MRLLSAILADTCDWCEPRLGVFAQRTCLYVCQLSVVSCQSAGLLIPVHEHLLDFFDLAKAGHECIHNFRVELSPAALADDFNARLP
jgi:hypothetical protein